MVFHETVLLPNSVIVICRCFLVVFFFCGWLVCFLIQKRAKYLGLAGFFSCTIDECFSSFSDVLVFRIFLICGSLVTPDDSHSRNILLWFSKDLLTFILSAVFPLSYLCGQCKE